MSFGYYFRIDADTKSSPSLTVKATVARAIRGVQIRKGEPSFDILTLDLGKGATAQTNSNEYYQVGDKVIANYKIGKSGRYYIEGIEPIQKPERKVKLP